MSAIPREQNYSAWLVKNGETVFSKLTQKISLSVSGKQASRQAITWSLVFLSQIFTYFLDFWDVILVEYPVLVTLGKFLIMSRDNKSAS